MKTITIVLHNATRVQFIPGSATPQPTMFAIHLLRVLSAGQELWNAQNQLSSTARLCAAQSQVVMIASMAKPENAQLLAKMDSAETEKKDVTESLLSLGIKKPIGMPDSSDL